MIASSFNTNRSIRLKILEKFPTIRAFSNHLGWYPEKMSRALNGSYKIPPHELESFACALGVSPKSRLLKPIVRRDEVCHED